MRGSLPKVELRVVQSCRELEERLGKKEWAKNQNRERCDSPVVFDYDVLI